MKKSMVHTNLKTVEPFFFGDAIILAESLILILILILIVCLFVFSTNSQVVM